jgi:polysaccharide deacetylase family protein (PEP-CTERM system associated)
MNIRATPIRNALTIDVEDYFQVAAFDKIIDPNAWDSYECRVEQNVDLLLQTLDDANTRATFFTLGWVAERYPAMTKRIVSAGHELGSHGYGHQKITTLEPKAFREDLIRAKAILEDLSAGSIKGYRAPSFSIGRKNLWAFDVLRETNHIYSSSVYPVKHDHYGMPEAPRFKYTTTSGLIEIPPSSIQIRERNFPASGGGYFRLLPYKLSAAGIRRINNEDKESAIFYCHPWEFDPNQPKIKNAVALSKFRHYVNLSSNLSKFKRLLSDFSWGRMDRVFSIT